MRSETVAAAMQEANAVFYDCYINLPSHIGPALRLIRLHKTKTQQEVAGGLTQGFVSKLENGQAPVGLDVLVLLCQRLDCSPSLVLKVAEVLARYEKMPKEELYAAVRDAVQVQLAEAYVN